MKEDLKIASVVIGTIVGAGLASGQEILQFFSLYGRWGFWGIIICCILYMALLFIIIDLSIKYRLRSYRDIMLLVLGKRAGIIADMIMTFFIFGGNVVMVSGAGALLNEYFGINKPTGIIIMSVAVFFVSIYSTRGLVAVNSIIVPFSTVTILVIGFLVLTKNGFSNVLVDNIRSIVPMKKNWIISSILYASFNITTATGVLCPMIFEYKGKSHFIKGCVIGSIVLTILALVINLSIVMEYPGSFYCEIPNLYIAKKFGVILPLFVCAAILLEMFSTEVADLYSLSKRIEFSLNFSYIYSIIIVLVLTIPFSFIGFSSLIGILYPANGFIGVLFCIGCLIKWIII